jgi:hypothetical protein
MHNDKIKLDEHLHQTYYGAQDQAIKDLIKHDLITTFVCTKTLIINKGVTTTLFSDQSDAEKSYGFTNLRIINNHIDNRQISDKCAINKITLRLGSMEYDTSYPSILVDGYDTSYSIPFKIMDKTSILPAVMYNRYNIISDALSDFTIQYDVVTIQNPIDPYQFVYQFLQYTGEESTNTYSKFKLCFNHPTSKIIVIASNKLNNCKILIDGLTILYFDTMHNISGDIGSRYEYNFTTPVNFSKINNAIFSCDAIDLNTRVNIFAESSNIAVIQGGQFDIMFC